MTTPRYDNAKAVARHLLTTDTADCQRMRAYAAKPWLNDDEWDEAVALYASTPELRRLFAPVTFGLHDVFTEIQAMYRRMHRRGGRK